MASDIIVMARRKNSCRLMLLPANVTSKLNSMVTGHWSEGSPVRSLNVIIRPRGRKIRAY